MALSLTPVTWAPVDATGEPLTDVSVSFTPGAGLAGTGTGTFVGSDPVTCRPLNGVVAVGLVPGAYTVTITDGQQMSAFLVTVPVSSASVDLDTLLPVPGVTPAPPVLSSTVALADAPVIAVNAALGKVFTVTLGGNRALGDPSNPVDGQSAIFAVTQDATGSRLLSYGAAYEFTAALPAPVLSTAAGVTDYLGFIYSAAASRWRFLAFSPGF